MNNNQINFFQEYFFKSNFPGWLNISNNLIVNGECVVAGTTPLWRGGIGNFIKTTQANGFIDCLLYEFDINEFKNSEYFKQVKRQVLDIENETLKTLQTKIEDIENI